MIVFLGDGTFSTKTRFITTSNQQEFFILYTPATDKIAITRNANYGKENGYLNSIDPRQLQVAAKVTF